MFKPARIPSYGKWLRNCSFGKFLHQHVAELGETRGFSQLICTAVAAPDTP
jgi:hypothetical protein